MDVPPLAFEQLIAPLSRREFLDACWSTRAVHLRAEGRNFDDYFSWAALDAVLNSGDLTYPSTLASIEDRPIPPEEFTRDGAAISPPALAALFQDGASLSIRSADAYWPPLKAVIAALYGTFFEKVHTNIYCSPADVQGFRCHYDLHEVFVLQVAGSKHWRVFPPTTVCPVEPWRPEDVPDVPPAIDVVLAAGDVLYIPRGHWHYAIARDSGSLHITAGVTTRKADLLLDWLRPRLLARPEWRSDVPLLGPAAADGALPPHPRFDDWFAGLRASLDAVLSDPATAAAFARDLFTDTTPTPQTTLVGGDGRTRPLDQQAFVRAPGVRHVIQDTGTGGVIVYAAGTEFELEGAPRPLLTRIFGGEPFGLADLTPLATGLDASELRSLLEAFVRSGAVVARAADAR